MEIKGSGDKYYTVNIDKLTCTCKDWSCRRHNFSITNPNRKCKHILEAIDIDSKLKLKNRITEIPPFLVSKYEISRVLLGIRDHPAVLKCSTDNKIFSGSQDSYINRPVPMVVEMISKSIPRGIIECAMRDLGYELVYFHNNKLFCKGGIYINIILSVNFLFQSLFYTLDSEELYKLSSISRYKYGLFLSEMGFVNDNDEIVDMRISTFEEFYDLLGLNL